MQHLDCAQDQESSARSFAIRTVNPVRQAEHAAQLLNLVTTLKGDLKKLGKDASYNLNYSHGSALAATGTACFDLSSMMPQAMS